MTWRPTQERPVTQGEASAPGDVTAVPLAGAGRSVRMPSMMRRYAGHHSQGAEDADGVESELHAGEIDPLGCTEHFGVKSPETIRAGSGFSWRSSADRASLMRRPAPTETRRVPTQTNSASEHAPAGPPGC
eukprot:4378141-Prymnesium_polylepis.3